MQRSQTTQAQKALKWRCGRTGILLDEVKFVVDFARLRDGGSERYIAVSINKFRARMYNEIGAERKRVLKVRCCERIINHDDRFRVTFVHRISYGADVDNCATRVCWRFSEDDSRFRTKRVHHVFHVGEIDERCRDARTWSNVVHQRPRAPVGIVDSHYVVTCSQRLQ